MRLQLFHQKARLSAASAIDQLRSVIAKSAGETVTRRLDLSELEDRILLSASPAAVMVESAASTVETIEVASPLESDSSSVFESPVATVEATDSELEQDSSSAEQASSDTHLESSLPAELDDVTSLIPSEPQSPAEQSTTEVIFVDEAAENYDELVADLQAQRDAGRAIDFFVLDSNADGIDQIADVLERYSDLDAVHIVSHGSNGAVKLGSTWLRIGSLDGYAGVIAGWGNAFSTDGDLLFYGCDLAAGSRGELLVESIAVLTGADVAASTDDTGSALRGGDWDLEFHNGPIETSVAFSAAVQENWSGLLATVAVTDFLDSDGEPRASTQSTAPTGGLPVPDFDSDGRDGRTVQKDSGSYNTSSSDKFQLWHTDDTGFLVDGNVSFTLYSAMLDFVTDKAGDVRVYLTETDLSGSNALGSPLASTTISTPAFTWSGGWDQDIVNFGTITRFIEPGRALAVKITVGNSADGDMMFAYDTATTPSSLDYDKKTSLVPTIIDLDLDNLSYTEDDGQVVLDQNTGVTIIDADSPDFDGGLLYVSITSGGDSGEDVLSVRNQGSGAGQIGFSGGAVTYEGTTIGTTTGGTSGNPLRIAFNANANATSVGALARNLTYENLDTANPTTSTRTVNFFLHDGDGGVSSTSNATITVVRENDAPVLNTAGASTLSSVVTDDFTNSGDRVVDIIASTGNPISDVDIGSQEGIAVTSVDNSNGDWQYSTNGGGAWSSFGAVSGSSAVLLDDEVGTRIRFVPNASFKGNATISFRAWDQTFGSNGQNGVDVASIGIGQDKAFSLATEVSTVIVSEIPTTSGIANVNDPEDDPNRDIDLFPSFADSEDADSALTYSVTNNTNAGLFDSTSIISGQFLRLDYKQDQFGTADVTVRATDTAGLFVETVFTVTLAPVNDDPVLDQNNQLAAFIGLTSTIDNTVLAASDVDNTAAEVEFTLTDVPDHGTLKNNGTTLNLSDTFTQADIDADLITYTHNGGASTTDSFAFDLTDNTTGNGGSHTLNMAISPAPPAIDNTTTDTTPKASGSDSFSHTTSGTDRLMLVGVSFGEDKGDSVSSITYNGTALTLVGAQDHSDASKSRVEIWSLVAPDVGTHNLVVNYSGANHEGATIGVMTFTNVDQATPLGTFAGNQGTSGSPSVTANSGDSELVFGVVGVGDSVNYNFTPGAGQTEQWDLFREKANGSGTTEDGAATVVTSWTYGGSKEWAAGAVSIKAAEPPAAAARLWLTTFGDIPSPSGAPGLDSWTAGEVLSFDDPNLTFDPAGMPANTTDGTFSSVFNLDDLVQDSDARLNGLHYVESNITVGGGANAFDLNSGDVLFSTQDSETLQSTNSLSVTDSDVVVFRPDTPGDYSSGTFTLLLDGSQIPQINLGIHGLTLVESNTMVGDSTLQAGTFLLVDADDANIYHYTADGVGAGMTSGTWSTLIEGADINIDQFPRGLDLIETTTDLGGTTLASGSILLSLNNDDTVGDNSIAVLRQDIFYLTVSKTEWDQVTTVADATLLLDGSDVGINAPDERFHGLTLLPTAANTAPTITSNGGGATAAVNVAENTTAVTTVTANDTDLPAQTLMFSISGGADQALFSVDSGSGVLTFASGPDFESPTDANTDNVYEVTVQVSDGQGGSDTQDISVTVTPVNEAPVNTVPASQVTNADEPLVFSTANGNAIQISDVDAGSSPLEVTLAVTNATLTLNGTSGLTFTVGDGASDSAMTFTGSLTSINNALEGLTLTPVPNFTGSASLQITTDDQGNTGAAGALNDVDNVSVNVNAVSLTPTNEFLVNSTTINVQETSSESRGSHRAVSISPNGDHVVVWSSQSQDGSGFGVYGQRYDKDGVAQGSEFRISQTTASDQKWATVATDGIGNFVVVWNSDNQDGSGDGVYARRYDANGVALSGEFLVNTTTSLDQDSPSIAMADDGRFVIVWEGSGSGDSSGIFGRLYDATGSAVGNEFLINTSTFGTQSDPAVAMNADGRFVVVWDDNAGFQGRLFDASGTPQGNQFTIDSSGSAGNGSVAMDSAGNFVATWRETVLDRAIFAQRYDSTGSTIGGQIGVNTTTLGDQTHPSIDLDEAGNFVIVWEGNGVGDANGVFGQKFDATGTPVNGEFRINQTTSGGQQNASVTLLDGDNFVVVWSGEGPGDTSGVFARQYSSGVNNTPTADAGGPYVINEDGTLNLDGTASVDPDSDPLTFAWDLDNDGNYGEAGEPTTVSPSVSWGTLQSFGIADDGVYTIGVQVDDGNGGVDSATTMLTVNNVSPTITSSASVGIAENTTAVLTVAATDPVDAVTYSLSGGNDQGLFTINSTTGALSFTAVPDFEIPTDNDTNNIYQVEVTADDGDGGTDVQTISVSVTDLNDETPVITAAQSFNVSESAVNGTSLGTVTATDADAGTTFSNWTITGGNTDGVFTINSSTGELTVADNTNLDFETSPGYVLSLTVSDGTNTSSVETVSVSVADQNDTAPVINPGQSFNISEAAGNGNSLGTVTATDADAGTTFSNWTITGGNTDGIFAINSSTGELIVADNTNLDFEMSPGYVLSLTVSDGTNTSSVETVSVSVNDANEAPSVSLSPGSSSLSENADTSSAIMLAAISVTDDALGTNSLSLSGPDAADFEIVGGSLRLRAGTPLDFETKPTYNVTVEVNDPLVGSSPDDSQNFTLTISNVNEAPTTSGLPNVVVNEDSPNVLIDLTSAFNDAETASSLLTYAVLSNSNPALFNAASISGGTLTLDFAADAHGSSVITVQASDPAGATVSTAFTVTVKPVQDAPVSTGDSYEVTGNSLAVTASTGVLANDSDADGVALTALLISGPSNGSLVLRSDGGFTYTPDAAFSGIDSFVYQPFDGTSVGPVRSVTLMVTRVAAPPPSSTDSGAGEPSDSTTPTESNSSTESTEGETAETSVESTPAVAEPVVAEHAAENVDAEPVQTEASTDDDRDDQMLVAYAIDSNDVSEFFGRGTERLELRDAESVRIASVRLDESTGDRSSSADSFRSSLRFDGEDLSYLVSTEFIAELEQVEEEFVFEGTVPEWAAGTAVATTTGLSVGYIMWMLRGGYVLASVLSTMPVWQNVDPLPVLAALDAADDGDDESLETMIDRASEEADQSEVQATDEAPADGKRKEELQ